MTERPAASAGPEGPTAVGDVPASGAPTTPAEAAASASAAFPAVPASEQAAAAAAASAPPAAIVMPATAVPPASASDQRAERAERGEGRRWWRRLLRSGAPGSSQSPSDAAGAEVVVVAPTSLLNRSPFQIGFVGTLGGMLAFLLLGAVVALQSILILAVLALFVALGLNPLVERLQRLRLPRGLAVAVVALGLLAVVGLAAWAVIPVLNDQINLLVANIPASLEGFRQNEWIAGLDRQFGVIDRITDTLGSGTWLEGLFGGILGASRLIANAVFSVLITLVLTLYFLASLPSIKQTIYSLAPASRRPRVRYLANEMFRRIGAYMGGLFTVVTLAASVAFVYLTIIGQGEYALALSVVVALFAFIPIVGPTVSMIIVSLVVFTQSVPLGIATVIFFLVYQQVDAFVTQPRLFSRSVNVPGALVVLAAVCGGVLFGIVGALLAIPTMASLLLLYREVLLPHLERA